MELREQNQISNSETMKEIQTFKSKDNEVNDMCDLIKETETSLEITTPQLYYKENESEIEIGSINDSIKETETSSNQMANYKIIEEISKFNSEDNESERKATSIYDLLFAVFLSVILPTIIIYISLYCFLRKYYKKSLKK